MKTDLFKSALLKADKVRIDLGINMFDPINVIDACLSLEITVRFVNISMEGMYVKPANSGQPNILLSNQRPLARRNYTCAHELGHHVFGHGTKLDALSEQQMGQPEYYDEDELLVDSFAGALLMPIAGIETAFAKRKLQPEMATAVELYTISSTFGVGFHTLIYHCRANNIISDSKAASLLKIAPAKVFRTLFPKDFENSYFKIIDKKAKLSVIDLEVSNYIILPSDVNTEGDHLRKKVTTTAGAAYLAVRPGIVRAVASDGTFNSFVRIQNYQYEGLAENRHLETIIE